MALKIYDTIQVQGDYPAVTADQVELPSGARLSEYTTEMGTIVQNVILKQGALSSQLSEAASQVDELGTDLMGLSQRLEALERQESGLSQTEVDARIQGVLGSYISGFDNQVNQLIDAYMEEALGGDY